METRIKYSDREARELLRRLFPRERLKDVRKELRKCGNTVRRATLSNLRGSIKSSGPSRKDLERGVRLEVKAKNVETARFRVTVGTEKDLKGTKGGAGFHKNRQGKELPLLRWFELGTSQRTTKSNGEHRAFRYRKGHPTGKIRAYAFLERAYKSTESRVLLEIESYLNNAAERIGRQYGG